MTTSRREQRGKSQLAPQDHPRIVKEGCQSREVYGGACASTFRNPRPRVAARPQRIHEVEEALWPLARVRDHRAVPLRIARRPHPRRDTVAHARVAVEAVHLAHVPRPSIPLAILAREAAAGEQRVELGQSFGDRRRSICAKRSGSSCGGRDAGELHEARERPKTKAVAPKVCRVTQTHSNLGADVVLWRHSGKVAQNSLFKATTGATLPRRPRSHTTPTSPLAASLGSTARSAQT